jgi:hypothetical protein
MAHASDGHDSEQLLADAQRLVARSREHEQRLSTLVMSLEGEADLARWSTHSLVGTITGSHLESVAAGTEIPSAINLLAIVRDLCVAARKQRQRTEVLVARMLGDRAVPDGHQVRVLVVDDSDDNRELAATVLEAAGFHVVTARNGLEAVVAAHREQPAVVLMDVTMPVLDGIEAARLIKASAETRHVKIG